MVGLRDNWGVSSRQYIDDNSARIHVTRLILIFGIVFFHVPMVHSDAGFSYPIYDFITETVLRFPVALLSLISGYLFFASEAFRSVRAAILKKFRVYGVPFLIFNLPFVFAVYLIQNSGFALDNRLVLVGANIQTWLDAAVSFSAQPINYPLYFLRDLLVVCVLAALIGGVFVRYPLPILMGIFIIVGFNFDQGIVLRNDIFLCFFMGGFVAIRGVNINQFDRYRWLCLLAVLPLICCVSYLYAPDEKAFIRSLGAVCFWPVTSFFMSAFTSAGVLPRNASKLQLYSFGIFMIHAPILYCFLSIGIKAEANIWGLLHWVFIALSVIGISALCVFLAQRFLPKVTDFALGGRL